MNVCVKVLVVLRKFHLDANPGQDTTEKFQQVNRAYEVLSDPDLKS